MERKNKNPSRKKVGFILTIGFLIIFPFALFFLLPMLVTELASSYLNRQGSKLLDCKIERETISTYRIASCELSLAAGNVTTRIQIEQLELTFAPVRAIFSKWPAINVKSLLIVLPKNGDSRQPGSEPSQITFPFSKLEIEKLIVKFGDDFESDCAVSLEPDLSGARLGISLKKGSGRYKQIKFTGAAAKLVFSNLPNWIVSTSSPAAIKEINNGFAFTDSAFDFKLSKRADGNIEFEAVDISTSIFDGHLKSAQLAYVKGRPTKFEVTAESLDLSSLLRLAGNSVQGTGRLSARVPVEINDGAIAIMDGSVTGVQGGELRYEASEQTKSSAADNPNLALALNALEEFHYETLDSKVQYDRDGNLTAAVSLGGTNPNLFAGRQINFNINIEENIPSLLHSIRLSQNPEQEFLPGEKR